MRRRDARVEQGGAGVRRDGAGVGHGGVLMPSSPLSPVSPLGRSPALSGRFLALPGRLSAPPSRRSSPPGWSRSREREGAGSRLAKYPVPQSSCPSANVVLLWSSPEMH